MSFFDTHTHLDYLAHLTGEPVSQLVENASKNRVDKLLIVAVLAADFDRIQKMTALYPEKLCYGLGLHPLYIREHQYSDLSLLEQKLVQNAPSCVAIAEIGLERAVPELLTQELWNKQCEFLEAQLDLAERFKLAVNLHSRQAQDQLFSFLKAAKLTKCGVIHGFSGSYEQAKRFVDLGYKIGVGGTITYQRANKTRQTISKLPLDCLLLETDSPDMPVFGFQGQPNRPERILNIFNTLCELRTESPEQIEQQIWQESHRIFSKIC